MGRRSGKARASARCLLAAGDRAILYTDRYSCDTAQQVDAARGRTVPVGETRVQRADGVHGCMEPVALRNPADIRDRAVDGGKPVLCAWISMDGDFEMVHHGMQHHGYAGADERNDLWTRGRQMDTQR